MGRDGIKRSYSKVSQAFIITVSLLLSFNAYGEELIDRVVAEVNGDPITYSEVQDKVRKKVSVEVSPFPAGPNDSEFTIALQDSINLKLIMQKAEELDLEITDESLEAEIDRFIKRRNLTRSSLKQALANEGMSYAQYKKDWRKQMLISQFQGREILPSVKVTDRDVEIFYLQETGASGESLKLTLRQLLVKVPSESSKSIKDAKKAVVDRVYKELKDGLDFVKAVKIYSDSESGRSNGGRMPPVLLKDLAPSFQKSVADLEEKQFTAPVSIGSSYYFFYLEKKEFAGSDEFRRAKPQLEARLRQEQIAEQTMKWIQDQRRRSEIKVID